MNIPSTDDRRRGNAYLAPRRAPEAKITRWSPHRNAAGTMLGFLSIALPSGLIINDAKLMIGSAGKRWIGMPSIKQVDKDGMPRLDAKGRQAWSPIIEFANSEARDRFNDLVLDALRRQHPEAFNKTVAP
jgi:DNA-binding cell septation regulator SpoVG